MSYCDNDESEVNQPNHVVFKRLLWSYERRSKNIFAFIFLVQSSDFELFVDRPWTEVPSVLYGVGLPAV